MRVVPEQEILFVWPADLALGPVKHHFELVTPEKQFYIDEFIAPIAAVILECQQLSVPVQFGIPASRQYTA